MFCWRASHGQLTGHRFCETRIAPDELLVWSWRLRGGNYYKTKLMHWKCTESHVALSHMPQETRTGTERKDHKMKPQFHWCRRQPWPFWQPSASYKQLSTELVNMISAAAHAVRIFSSSMWCCSVRTVSQYGDIFHDGPCAFVLPECMVYFWVGLFLGRQSLALWPFPLKFTSAIRKSWPALVFDRCITRPPHSKAAAEKWISYMFPKWFFKELSEKWAFKVNFGHKSQ